MVLSLVVLLVGLTVPGVRRNPLLAGEVRIDAGAENCPLLLPPLLICGGLLLLELNEFPENEYDWWLNVVFDLLDFGNDNKGLTIFMYLLMS